MKKAFVIGLGVVTSLLAAALIIPSFLDWNDYKAEIQDTVRSLTGRELVIDGNISFRIVPSPALSVERLTVQGETADDPAFVALDHLDVQLSLFPLLKGTIEVDSVVLVGAKIDLQRLTEDRTNWDFLTSNSKTQDESNEKDLKINRFEIQNSEIRYRDVVLGRDDTILNLDALVRADTAIGPFNVEAEFEYAQLPYALKVSTGRIEERRSFPLSIEAIINEQSPGIKFQGTIVLDGAASAGSGQLTGSGNNMLRLVNGLTSLAMGSAQDYSLIPVNLRQAFEFDAPLVLTKARLGTENLTVKIGNSAGAGRLLYVDQTDGARFDVGLNMNTLKYEDFYQTVANPDPSPINVAIPIVYDVQIGAVSYRNGIAQRVSVKGDMSGNNVRIERVSAGLPGSSNIEMKGNYKLDNTPEKFSGALQLTSDRLRELLNWLGYSTADIPADKLAGFSVETDIGLSADTLRLKDIVGQIDITAFSGDIDLNLEAPNAFKIKGKVERFNLDAYAPHNQDQRGAGGWDNVVPQFDEALNDLTAFQGDIDLEIKQFGIADAQLGDLHFEASILPDRVHIRRLDATNFRGIRAAMNGQLLGIDSRPSFNMNVDLKADNIASFLRWAEIETSFDPFQLGAVSIAGNLTGRPDQMQLDLRGNVAGAGYSVKGAVSKLDPVPGEVTLEYSLSHANAAELMRRFALPEIIKAANSRIAITGTAVGPKNAIALVTSVEVDAGKAQFNGTYRAVGEAYRVEGALNANHPNFLAMTRIFGAGLSPANDNIGAFQLRAIIDSQPHIYNVSEIVGNAGSASVSGHIRINMQAERPTFAGDLKIGTLALDQFMSPARSGAEQAKYAAGQRWSRTPFAFGEATKWDGTLTLAADMISYENYRYGNSTLAIHLNNGVLKIDNFRGGLFGGRTSSEFQMDLKGTPIGSLTFTLDEASLEEALQAAAAIKPASGTLSISTDLNFVGNSQFDIISSLGGAVELWTYNGVIRGVDIDRLSNRLESITRVPDFLSLVGSALAGGETPFQNIRTRFEGRNGVFTANRIDAQVDGANLSGALAINLPAWQLQGNSAIKLVSPADAPAVGMAYSGDIDAPKIDYQTADLRNYMVRKFMAALAAQPAPNVEGTSGAAAGSPSGGLLQGILPSTQTAQPAAGQTGQPAQTTQPPASAGAAILNGILGVLRPAQPNPPAESETDDGGGNR